MLARVAGYNALEINASQDRAGEEVKHRMLSAAHMSTSGFGNGRPTLLVMDELDGVANTGRSEQGIISLLLDMANGVEKSLPGTRMTKKQLVFKKAGQSAAESDASNSESDNKQTVMAKKGRKKGGKPFNQTLSKAASSRPIIAICNDLYAPVLRPLLSAAVVFNVKRPATSRIVARLMEVCEAENLAADSKTLSHLVDFMEGDVRSCLHTLQVHARSW